MHKTWALVLFAVGLGMVGAVMTNLAIHLVTAETVGETMGRIVLGCIVHPIIAVIAAVVWRRRHTKTTDTLRSDSELEQRGELALAA